MSVDLREVESQQLPEVIRESQQLHEAIRIASGHGRRHLSPEYRQLLIKHGKTDFLPEAGRMDSPLGNLGILGATYGAVMAPWTALTVAGAPTNTKELSQELVNLKQNPLNIGKIANTYRTRALKRAYDLGKKIPVVSDVIDEATGIVPRVRGLKHLVTKGAPEAGAGIKIGTKASKDTNILSHTEISKSEWMENAKAHYNKHFGTRPDPMRGYPQWTDDAGEVYRATPGGKNKANPEGPRNLTAVTRTSRTKMLKTRKANEDKWVGELRQVLDEFGSPEDFERYSTYIKAKNLSQAKRVKLLNQILKRRGIKESGKQLTIGHSGALKQEWPNLPDNRWEIQTRTANAAEGAIADLPDFNIRMSGTSKSVREWVIRQKIRESLGPKADIMGDLPVSIKRKILNAKPVKNAKGEITETVDDVINDILQKYDALKIKKVKPTQFPDNIQKHIKRSQEIGITEPSWKDGSIDYIWRPQSNTGQIDIPPQSAKGFKGLRDEFFEQIENLPSGSVWELNPKFKDAKRRRIYAKLFEGDNRITRNADETLGWVLRVP